MDTDWKSDGGWRFGTENGKSERSSGRQSAHFDVMFFEQPRNKATKPDNFVPSLLCCSTIPNAAGATCRAEIG